MAVQCSSPYDQSLHLNPPIPVIEQLQVIRPLSKRRLRDKTDLPSLTPISTDPNLTYTDNRKRVPDNTFLISTQSPRLGLCYPADNGFYIYVCGSAHVHEATGVNDL